MIFMKIKKTILLLFLLMVLVPVFSQTSDNNHVKKERLRYVEFFHYAVGFETSFNKNLYFSPELMIGIGSYRNLINADIGARYMLGSPFVWGKSESLVVHQVPVFFSVRCNVYSWKTNCVSIGGEIEYCMPITVFHHYGDTKKADKDVSNEHFSGRVNVGVKLDRLGIGAFYEYDFAPMMNQKYVFESAEYDYDKLHDSLFERMRFGVSLTYYFIIKS